MTTIEQLNQRFEACKAQLRSYPLRITARSKMTHSLERRCSLINMEGVCRQCTELNGIFNPKQKTHEELVNIEMVREAENKSKEELFNLRLQIVQSIDPFESGAAELQLRHFKHNKKVREEFLGRSEGMSGIL